MFEVERDRLLINTNSTTIYYHPDNTIRGFLLILQLTVLTNVI